MEGKGLYPKYHISKYDGSSANGDYFVLNMASKDQKHARACRTAILVYADMIEDHLPELAEDIRAKYGRF